MVYFFKSLRALMGVAALAAAVPAFADELSEVTVTATRASMECTGLSVDEARRMAQQATRDGAHRKAAECFRAAGDLARANRAQIRASADSGAAATRQVNVNVATAKEQARRIRAAFR
jgi:hypothetical protein